MRGSSSASRITRERLYYMIDEQYWYCWVGDAETGCYKAIDRPKAFENTTGIGGIG